MSVSPTERSASTKTMKSPEAISAPFRTAKPFPRLRSSRITFDDCSSLSDASRPANSAELSELPSSTKTISHSAVRNRDFDNSSMVAAIRVDSLNIGTTRENLGTTFSSCEFTQSWSGFSPVDIFNMIGETRQRQALTPQTNLLLLDCDPHPRQGVHRRTSIRTHQQDGRLQLEIGERYIGCRRFFDR
ncbi:unannotated protein [freshwater metagenome]|uniref:Unannotated protein n=1 Tax=freshwater metagenome TaxID=449393 RepID=A0A6J6Y4L6_9ZZZZ